MAIGQNQLGTGKFLRRDRRHCATTKEPLGDCRIGNEVDWLLTGSPGFVVVLVVLVVVAAKASDCRVASVVGGSSPAIDGRRTCSIEHENVILFVR